MDESANFAQAGCSLVFAVILLIVAFLVGGSFRTKVEHEFVGVNTASRTAAFEEEYQVRHWLWGMVQGRQPDLRNLLDVRMSRGERLVRLKVLTRHSGVDLLITGLTLGIYCPMTVNVSGNLAAADQEAPPSVDG